MEKNIQYFLEVQENQVIQEEGNFFPATPFIIRDKENQQVLSIEFNRNKNNQVVYFVKNENSVLGEWTHPDYVPEIKKGVYLAVENLTPALTLAAIALVKLNIIRDKTYKEKLKLENLSYKKSFLVEQNFFDFKE